MFNRRSFIIFMKPKNYLLLLLLLAIYKCSCIAQPYNISAKLTGFHNNSKVELIDETDNPVNSALLKKGKFSLSGQLKNGPKYLTIAVYDNNDVYQCEVFAGESDVLIQGAESGFPEKLKIKGGSEQVKYNRYQSLLSSFSIKNREMIKAIEKEVPNSPTYNKLAVQYRKLSQESFATSRQYLTKHPDTYFAANKIYEQRSEVGQRALKQFYTALPQAIRQSIYGKRLKLCLSPIINQGNHYLNFSALDKYGKTVNISDTKGKYVLLNFSSIHCPHSEESMSEIDSLSKKYTEKLQVVTFSLDNKRDWLKGLENNINPGLNISDNKGYFSEPVLRYGVLGIPSFVMIAPDGTIVNKWSGYYKPSTGASDLESNLKTSIPE